MWYFIVSLSQLQQLQILKWCELFKWRLELNLRACTVKTHTCAVNIFAYETQVSHTRNKCRVAYGHAGWLTSAKRVRWLSLMLSIAALQSRLKPVLNWTNVCSPEHTSDTSTNYDSFLNWTFSSPNMVRTVQTLLHSQLACNEMQASARTCGRRAADSMIENVG